MRQKKDNSILFFVFADPYNLFFDCKPFSHCQSNYCTLQSDLSDPKLDILLSNILPFFFKKTKAN